MIPNGVVPLNNHVTAHYQMIPNGVVPLTNPDTTPKQKIPNGLVPLTPPSYATHQIRPHGVNPPTNPEFVAMAPSTIHPIPVPAETLATPPRARHVCQTCAKSFGRPSDLKRHAKKHSPGASWFKCPSEGCDFKPFSRKDKMRCHVRNKHPEMDARTV